MRHIKAHGFHISRFVYVLTALLEGGNWMRQFHDLAYLADKKTVDDAKVAHSMMTIYIQWSNMPQEIKDMVASEPGESCKNLQLTESGRILL